MSSGAAHLRVPWSSTARARRPAFPAWLLTAALGAVYLVIAPQSPDLAAASYRSWLLSSEGLTIWDNAWYGGHHLPAYSLLAPALGALIGPQLLAAIAMTLATALFTALVEDHFPPRASRIAALWFAVGASISLLSSRVPFDLGLALGLAALLAARRKHPLAALALTLVTSLASPVAGAFLALAMLSWGLTTPRRGWPLLLCGAALAPIAGLALAFPEGGSQPFVASAFYPAFAAVLLIGALMPREQRTLRVGIGLYALAMLGSYLLPTAVGGNADRLGALAGAPVAALALAGAHAGRRRLRLLIVLAPVLLYWQANAPVTDFLSAESDAATAPSYYRPLLGELHSVGIGFGARPARIEVVPGADHWEARYVAPAVMIARGWERQLDGYRNALFYEGAAALTAGRYRAWLSEQAVSYVALGDAPLDYSAKAEARLLRGQLAGGLPAYLREVWHSAHWRLFEVLSPQPLAQAPAQLQSAGHSSFSLLAPRAGSYVVRIHFTPYWALTQGQGCVSRAPGDWTSVQARAPGTLKVAIRFALTRVFSRGTRCS